MKLIPIPKDDVLKALEGWRKCEAYIAEEGGSACESHDLYSEAAYAVTMAQDAKIPLEELVPDEVERKRLTDNAALAEPYGGSADRL